VDATGKFLRLFLEPLFLVEPLELLAHAGISGHFALDPVEHLGAGIPLSDIVGERRAFGAAYSHARLRSLDLRVEVAATADDNAFGLR
jgi:hypothetical protein